MMEQARRTDLEPLVLQDLLDCNVVGGDVFLEKFCLEDDTEGAIADDFAVGVNEVALVAGLAVRGNNLDDLAGIVDGYGWKRGREGSVSESSRFMDGNMRKEGAMDAMREIGRVGVGRGCVRAREKGRVGGGQEQEEDVREILTPLMGP